MPMPAILDLVYPRTCSGCSRPLEADRGHLCWECLASLDIIVHPFCSKCGDPVDGMVEGSYVCSWCVRNEPAFDLARSAARYRGPLVVALQQFKYDGATCVGGDLVELLFACVITHFESARFDVVAFVPLHPSKERRRTFNQSRLLASGLASRLKMPLFARALRRVKNTPTQTSLTLRQRQENIRKAFEVPAPEWVAGRRILLVDDIMTTGATVAECGRVLKEAGAASVHVATVARG